MKTNKKDWKPFEQKVKEMVVKNYTYTPLVAMLNGEMMLTVHSDLSIEYGKGYSPEKMDELVRQCPAMEVPLVLIREIERLRAIVNKFPAAGADEQEFMEKRKIAENHGFCEN